MGTITEKTSLVHQAWWSAGRLQEKLWEETKDPQFAAGALEEVIGSDRA